MDDPVIASLQEALRQSPDNLPLRWSLARLLLDKHRFRDAEEVLRRGLERAPGDGQLQMGLAEAFYGQGRFAEALVLLEEPLAQPDAPAQAFLLAARCHFQREDPREAGKHYRRALEKDPDLEDVQLEHLARRPASARPTDADDDDDEDEPLRELASGEPRDGSFDAYIERSTIAFDDVGGMAALKDEIALKIIRPLQHPELYAAYGKKAGGGILLFGPPGCGKTHLARATAGEVEAGFLSVAISDVLDMYTGQSERNLRDIFARARHERPTVLFFDEVDALAASRRDMRQSAGRQVINQFLAELDGVDADNEGVLILAATNAPWHLDGAFRRPGRFDRILFVPPPDEEARAAILGVLLRDKPAGDVDTQAVARKTADFSGADLGALVSAAVEKKLKRAFASGIPEPLATKDMLAAAKDIKPSTREWFATARNHALYANEGGLYDDILAWLGIKR